MTDSAMKQARWAGLFAVLVAAYLFLVWPAVHGPFFFDDFPNLSALSKSEGIGSLRDLGIYLSEARSFPGRPLAMLSFLPQREFWPSNPLPFKVVNLAIHLLNAGLVYWLARTLCRALLSDAGKTSAQLAALVAFAWLVHPIQLSAVMLVVQRMTLLCTTFTLVGLTLYVHALLATDWPAKKRALLMTAGIAGGTLLALLCKESGLLLPFYAWVIDATLLRKENAGLPRALAILRRVLLFPAIALVLAFLAWTLLTLNAPITNRNFTIAERLLTESRVIVDYVFNILVPRYSAYGIYHDDFVVSRGLLAPWSTLPSILVIVLAFVLAVRHRSRHPLAAFAVLWYLAGHLLESGPIALELYFDHRNYLPLAGPVFAAVIGIARLPSGATRRALAGMGCLWLLGCLLSSALYARVWSDQAKLAYFFSQEHPASARAQGEFAEVLFQAGRIDDAQRVMEASIRRQPSDIGPRLSLVFLKCSNKSLSADELSALKADLASAPWSQIGFQGLEPLRLLAEQKTCPAVLDERAWLALSDASLANPAFHADGVAMGSMHYQRHSLAVARGDLDDALRELELTAKFDPDPEIVRLQAKYLVSAGLTDEAIRRLKAYDPSTRPLLRRLLVDDVAINAEAIAVIRANATGAKATQAH